MRSVSSIGQKWQPKLGVCGTWVQSKWPHWAPYVLDHHVDLYIDIRYVLAVLTSFADKTTQDIYDGINSRQARKLPSELHDKARRLLDQINAAPTLDVLRIPPSNRLEKLKGDRAGFWSLRINDQWRIIFCWQGQDALDVQVIDYH
jgi:proteic killer suppression protein